MDIKEKSKEARGSLQQGIYKVINPFVRLLIRMGVTPNMVTTVGLLGNLLAASLIVYAGWVTSSWIPAEHENFVFMRYGILTIGGACIILFSVFDMLDGQVARLGNMSSTFGALYDSVLDRYCELFTLGGVAFYLICCNDFVGALITFLALVGSIMVSYVRARAEGLDVECKIGFMQRPERVVLTTVAVLATGITGWCEALSRPEIIFDIAMGFIAVFANMTAFARIAHVRKALNKRDKN